MLCSIWLVSAVLATITPSLGSQIAFQQPESESASDYPYRVLEWGEINILHTTDTHGWLLGHQVSEGSFSGDWGDLYSFVTRMKEEAKRRGVDLLVVDSGDRVDGNGFVDGEPSNRVKGSTAMSFFKEMPYDIITTGNHELYNYTVAEWTYRNLIPAYGERYVVSNVDITVNNLLGRPVTKPMSKKYRKFVTEQGRKVTSLGILFNFLSHAKGIDVQSPLDMIHEDWFKEAIEELPDFFLLVGHMSVRSTPDSEWTAVFKAIRTVHPTVPILIFGGHHHIRDCLQEDDRSMSLASGRYMETVGWMSLSGLGNDPKKPLRFSRRYLDQNRNTYAYHAGEDFDTHRGLAISKEMGQIASSFNLTFQFGIAPQSYFTDRYPLDHEKSLLRLITQNIFSDLVYNYERSELGKRSVKVLNTGGVRFDVYKGPFTKNSQWAVVPFTNKFQYIQDVPRSVVKRLLPYMNIIGERRIRWIEPSMDSLYHTKEMEAEYIEHVYRQNELQSHEMFEQQFGDDPRMVNLTTGYVTKDLCPGLGDDTLHRPNPRAFVPWFASSEIPSLPAGVSEEEDVIDVVFLDFIQPFVISALNVLQDKRVYGSDDARKYTDSVEANNLLQTYASLRW